MVDDLLTLRDVADGDTALLRRWRNDPDSVRSSREQREVEPDEHAAWLARLRADPRRALWIAEVAGDPVGQVRLDAAPDGTAEVSVVVAPEARGAGWAGPMLKAAATLAPGLGVRRIVAHVKPDNERSLRMLRSAGYTPAGAAPDGLLRLVRALD